MNFKTIFALTVGAIFSILSPASAANLYWDSNSTTAGAGGTPTGTWGVDNFWNTDSTGANLGAFQIGTLSIDDLFFSAGSDAINAYIISLNASTQNARLITFEDGTATLNNGTLSLGNGGGITVTSNTVTGATISSNLTISGSQTFNVAASRTLTLDTGTFTRNAGATLNVASTGTVTTTMTGLASGSMVNGIIGPWASYGSGASTKYATIDGSNNIVGLTGTAAATAANVTSTLGTLNYDVAAVGTLGAGASINTLRYTGAAGTIAGALTTNGIMNVGGNALTLSGLITSGTGGIVLNAANGNLIFPHTTGGLSIGSNPLTITGSSAVTFGTINQNNITLTGSGNLFKNGSGVFILGGLNTGFTGNTTVNGGTLLVTALGSIGSGNLTLNGGIYEEYWGNTFSRALGSGAGQVQLTGGASGFSENGSTGMTVNLGGATATVVWGSAFFNPSTFVLQSDAAQTGSTINFQNGINLSGGTRTIASYKTSNLASGATISGVISNSTGTAGLIKEGAGLLILSNSNTYNGSTIISAGILQANSTAAIGNSSATNTLIFNGGTLRAGGAITSAATRSVTMTQTGIIDTNGQAISIAGNIGGAGGLTKISNGTLTLSGTNNFGGVTTVNTGTLQLVNEVSLASNTAANLNVKSNATLALNVGGAGQFTASTINTLLTNISVANTAAQGLQAGAKLVLDTATGSTFTPTSAIANSTGAFGGAIGLTKLGNGTLVLDKTNTYSGNTLVSAGTLEVQGSIATSANIINNAALVFNSASAQAYGNTILGTGTLAKSGAGTLTLSAINTFSGNTTVSGGNLTLSNALALRNSALVTTGAGTVTLGSGVTTPTFGGLSGASGNLADIITNYSTVTNITLNPAATVTYGGVIANHAANVSLTKTGAGTQTLTGANLYTGATTINQGTLNLGGATANGSLASTVLNLSGGTLSYTRTGSQTQTFTTTNINPGASGATTVAGNFLKLGNVERTVGSTLNVGNLGSITTTDSNSNGILGGWATFNNANWAVANGDGTGISALGSFTTTATAGTTAANYTNNNIDVTSSAGLVGGVITPNSLRFNNAITTPTVTLAAGDNVIGSGGILVTSTVGNNLSTITGGNLAGSSGGDLIIHQHNTSNSLTIASLIKNNTSATALTKSGAGNLNLTNNSNSYSGGTFLNAGTLTYTNDGQLGLAGSRNITFGSIASLTGYDTSSLGTITVNAGAVGSISANTITFATTTGSGTIRGTGGQNKTLNLGNAGTFTGDVALAYNANNNSGANTPHISFSSLNDAVGSSIQIYRQGGGTDSGQIGQVGLAGNTGSLTFDNRQIQLLAKTGGTGQSMATNYLLNNNGSASNKWVINTNLLNLYDRDSTLGLGGANTGDNAFNGTISNSAFTGAYTSGTGVLSLAKTEAGTWILSNASNSYTGGTNISGGTLGFVSGALGSSGTINASGGTLLWLPGNTQDISSRLAFTAAATSTFNTYGNDVTFASAIGSSTTGNFVKTGLGTLTLQGTNTFTSGTKLLNGGGTLVLDYTTNDNRKLSTGALTLAGGTIVLKGGTTAAETASSTLFNTSNAGTFFVRDGGTAKINLNAFTVGTQSVVSFSHDGMATTDRTNVAGILGAWFIVGNRWAANETNGADGNIVGYTGGTTFTPGSTTNQDVNYDLAGGATLTGGRLVNTLRIESTANDQILNLGANVLTVSNLTGTNALTNTSGGLLYAGGANGNYTITGTSAARLTPENGNGQALLINVSNGGTLNLDVALSNSGSTLNKAGEGTLVMQKDSAGFTAETRVYQGALRLASANATGTTGGGITVQNRAALELTGGLSFVADALNITGEGVSSGGALKNFSGANIYQGAITIGTGGARINSDSGTLTLTGGVVTSLFNNVTFGGAGNSNVSTAAISGAGGLVKDGAGTLNLNFANTYTGATNINNGIFAVTGAGSINSTSAINVAAGAKFVYNSSTALTVAPTLNGGSGNQARFSGTATINAAMSLNSIDDVLAPGNSPGIQNFATSQTWESFSYEWELNNWVEAVAGVDYDQIQITGGLTLSGSSYALNIFSLDSLNMAGLVGAGGDNTFTETNKSWTILTATGGITGFNASSWSVNSTNFQDTAAGQWSLAQSDNNLVLSYTVIPEPKAALLGGLGILLLLRRRR